MRYGKIKQMLSIENFIIIYMIVMVMGSLSFMPTILLSGCNIFFYIMAIILTSFIIIKKYIREKRFPVILNILFIFLIGYLISILINKQNIFGNLKSFAITLIQCIIVFYYIYDLPKVRKKAFVIKFFRIFNMMMLIITVVSLLCFLFDIVIKPGYLRYYGLFSNPNNSSLCVIAAYTSLYPMLHAQKDKTKIFYFISIVLQMMFISLTVSRGATILFYITFIFGIMIYAFTYYSKKIKALLIGLALSILCVVSYNAITKIMPSAQGILHIDQLSSDKNKQNAILSDEGREDTKDSNSIRFNMLAAGFNTFKNHPLFGVTSRNLATVVSKENPNLYLKGIEGAGLHNTFMQVLTSNGIIGFVSIAILIIICFWEGIKQIKSNKDYLYILAAILGILVYMNVSVAILYFSNAFGIIFWILLATLAGKTELDMEEYRTLDDMEIKKIQLEVLDEVANYCEEHNLKYSIFYGTMIGTVRHQGYIPWDDDIDIAMPREDYEKLLNDFRSDKVSITDFDRNRDFWYTFGKAFMKNTRLVENANINASFALGVNIDVFPLDNSLDTAIAKKQTILYKMLTVKLVRLSRTRKLYKNMILFVIKILLFIIPTKWIISKMIKNGKSGNHKIAEKIGAFSEGSQMGLSINKSSFDSLIKMPFEGRSYKLCANFDEILKIYYGNYMQLPPLEEQVTHHNYTAYSKK